MGTHRAKIFFQEILTSWKQMLGINKSQSFLLTCTIYDIDVCSKNSKHPWWSHFNIEFSWQCNFSGKTFLLYPISLPTIQGEVYLKMKINKWKLLLSKTTGISVNVIGRPQRGKCSAWVHFLQVTTSHVLTCKFFINQLLQRSASVIIKRGCCFELQSRASGIESRAVTTKWGNF